MGGSLASFLVLQDGLAYAVDDFAFDRTIEALAQTLPKTPEGKELAEWVLGERIELCGIPQFCMWTHLLIGDWFHRRYQALRVQSAILSRKLKVERRSRQALFSRTLGRESLQFAQRQAQIVRQT